MRTTTLLNRLIRVYKGGSIRGLPLQPLIEACADRHEQTQQTRLVIETVAPEIAKELLNIEAGWLSIEGTLEEIKQTIHEVTQEAPNASSID
jgi:hypothetical protein